MGLSHWLRRLIRREFFCCRRKQVAHRPTAAKEYAMLRRQPLNPPRTCILSTLGGLSKSNSTLVSWARSKAFSPPATAISECEGVLKKANLPSKTAPTSTASTKPGPFLTVKRRTGLPKKDKRLSTWRTARSSVCLWTTRPFRFNGANLLKFERILDFRAGTLDREILWETTSGKQHRHPFQATCIL